MRCTNRNIASVSKRRGSTLVELIVAAGLLIALMSILSPLSTRLGRLWHQSRHYQLALDEVNNQLEQLTTLSPEERDTKLQQLQVSESLSNVFPEAKLSAEVTSDDDGERLTLRLQWDSSHGAKPLSLTAWMPPRKSPVEATAAGEDQP